MSTNAIARYPITSPWLMRLKLLAGRHFSLGLSVADALISFDGLADNGVGYFESAMTAAVIGIVQWQIGLAVVSGDATAQGFKAKFMSGTGTLGALQRATGFASIAFVIAFYSFDIWTNVLAFSTLPMTMAIIMAIGFSLGDELIGWLVDLNQTQYHQNAALYHASEDTHKLQVIYQRSKLKTGVERATEAGQKDGENWRPTTEFG